MNKVLIFFVTGVIHLTSKLDYENIKELVLEVSVFNSGVPPLSALAMIYIEVQNINDHAPVFKKSLYNFSLSENSPPGTIVGTIQAVDLDEGIL